jgi:hypothetical protein
MVQVGLQSNRIKYCKRGLVDLLELKQLQYFLVEMLHLIQQQQNYGMEQVGLQIQQD